MKSILASVVTCLVLFGASAGVSYYLNKPAPDEDADTELADQEPLPVAPEPTATPEPTVDQVEQMPVALLADQSQSVEAVMKMTKAVKQMQRRLEERERRLQKEEQRVQLLFQDLTREQTELKAFSDGVEAKVSAMDRLVVELNDLMAQLDEKQALVEEDTPDAAAEDTSRESVVQARVGKVKDWFANLEPTQAAEYLKEFANGGQIDFAAALLQEMPDRQKSQVLSALNDPQLVSAMIEALDIAPAESP